MLKKKVCCRCTQRENLFVKQNRLSGSPLLFRCCSALQVLGCSYLSKSWSLLILNGKKEKDFLDTVPMMRLIDAKIWRESGERKHCLNIHPVCQLCTIVCILCTKTKVYWRWVVLYSLHCNFTFFKGMDRCTCFCLQFTVSMMRTTLPCGKKKKILQQCLFLSNFFETVCLNLLVCVCLRIKGIVFLMSTLFQRVHWNNHKDWTFAVQN